MLKIGTPVLKKTYFGTHQLGIGLIIARHRDGGTKDDTLTYDVLFELIDFDGAALFNVKREDLITIIIHGPNSANFRKLALVAKHEFGIDVEKLEARDVELGL